MMHSFNRFHYINRQNIKDALLEVSKECPIIGSNSIFISTTKDVFDFRVGDKEVSLSNMELNNLVLKVELKNKEEKRWKVDLKYTR
jgi:hypothetical protein